MGFLWDLSQNFKIENAWSEAQRADRKADRAGHKAAASVESVERLALICRAMWELVSESTPLTEADLEKKIRAIDLKDGRLDAKYRPERRPRPCRHCGNNMHPNQVKCQFCGAPAPDDDPFDKVNTLAQ
jgi:hypothetical protein